MLKLEIANIPQKVQCIKFKQKNEYSGDHFEDEYADQVMVHTSPKHYSTGYYQP